MKRSRTSGLRSSNAIASRCRGSDVHYPPNAILDGISQPHIIAVIVAMRGYPFTHRDPTPISRGLLLTAEVKEYAGGLLGHCCIAKGILCCANQGAPTDLALGSPRLIEFLKVELLFYGHLNPHLLVFAGQKVVIRCRPSDGPPRKKSREGACGTNRVILQEGYGSTPNGSAEP